MNGAPAWALTIIHLTIGAVAFAAGLSTASARLAGIRRNSGLMLRALLTVLVVVPVIAVVLVKLVAPGPAAGSGILIAALAIGPVAAFRKSKKDSTELDFALGLDVALLALSVVYVPIAVALVGAAFDRHLRLSPGQVAQVVLPLQLLPLLAGLAVGKLAPRFTERVERPLTLATNIGLGLIALLVVIIFMKPMLAIGVRSWIFVGSFACLAIATGHLLGGPAPSTRMVLASFSSLRYPGLAIAISALSPERAVLPVVLAYSVCSLLALSAYLAAGRSSRKPAGPPLEPRGGLRPA